MIECEKKAPGLIVQCIYTECERFRVMGREGVKSQHTFYLAAKERVGQPNQTTIGFMCYTELYTLRLPRFDIDQEILHSRLDKQQNLVRYVG
jgi:hypothetical protein